MNPPIDSEDRRIIQLTQTGLPLTPRPYHVIAEQLGLSPTEVMTRLEKMLAEGIIRRIGVIPNHYALGYRANAMTVWDIPDDLIDTFGEQIGQLEFVSHCYRRPRHLPHWPYNLFVMVHGHTRPEAEGKIEQIVTLLGTSQRGYKILYSTRILKKTGLRV